MEITHNSERMWRRRRSERAQPLRDVHSRAMIMFLEYFVCVCVRGRVRVAPYLFFNNIIQSALRVSATLCAYKAFACAYVCRLGLAWLNQHEHP